MKIAEFFARISRSTSIFFNNSLVTFISHEPVAQPGRAPAFYEDSLSSLRVSGESRWLRVQNPLSTTGLWMNFPSGSSVRLV